MKYKVWCVLKYCRLLEGGKEELDDGRGRQAGIKGESLLDAESGAGRLGWFRVKSLFRCV